MYIVGLTGGIGSGKSAAAEAFSALGVVVVDADVVARQVVEPGTSALDKIVQHFGVDMLNSDGSLNRAALRTKVFADAEERKVLESITHPAIGETMLEQLNGKREEGEALYRILESPLLLETSQKLLTQRILLIDASEQVQIERTMKRDNNSETQVRAIINAQMPREEKRALADDIIENNGTLSSLNEEVDKLHQQYQILAQQHAERENNQ